MTRKLTQEQRDANKKYYRRWRKENPTYDKLYRARDPEKRKKQKRAEYHRNKKVYQEWGRTPFGRRSRKSSDLKKMYGITLDFWERMFELQDKRCAICKSLEPGGVNWHTDHDHTTNKVRGILCHHCNLLLGNARDNISVLEESIMYLKRQGI